MNTDLAKKITKVIEECQHVVDNKKASMLELEKCSRIVKRLDSFSPDCEICHDYLVDLERYFEDLRARLDELTKDEYKRHTEKLNELTSHLQNEHDLIPEGHYMSIFMSLGLSFGLLFGLLLFDNVALGLPFGMIIGIAIGTAKDAEANKKGIQI